MEYLFNVAFENVIKGAYEQCKNKKAFCPNQCPYQKYCKNHKDFQKMCEKRLTNENKCDII